MKHTGKQWKITGFIPLIAFALLAVCLIGVLLTGAGVYRSLVDNTQASYAQRSAVQYVTTRVRQADAAGSIRVEDRDGISVLLLEETVSGKSYVTHVYCYDGKLRELFAEAEYAFSPEDGEILLDAKELRFAWEPPVLSVEIHFADGARRSFALTVRSGQEGTP